MDVPVAVRLLGPQGKVLEPHHLPHLLAQPQLRIGLESLAPVCGFCRIHNDVPFLAKHLWTSRKK